MKLEENENYLRCIEKELSFCVPNFLKKLNFQFKTIKINSNRRIIKINKRMRIGEEFGDIFHDTFKSITYNC